MNRAFNRKKDKSWMHTPEALAKHFIAYNAKFLGNTEVDQPKGTEVVKDAVRKLKFQRHIKKSEGQKIPKVELQISIYGVKILDPKSKEVQYNCQLHRISFCADDKTDKRIFTFICKDSESNKHLCYVFDSEKCAEEITLTIGQAFDLAYKKFLESGGKDIQDLEAENAELKTQLQMLEEQLMIAQVPPLLHSNSCNDAYMLESPASLFWCHNMSSLSCLEMSSVTLTPMSSPDSNLSAAPMTPPASEPALDVLPHPPGDNMSSKSPTDLFDMPFDPFTCGAADFPPDVQSKLDEMQEGFKMGLTVEGTVFSIDPLEGRC
ncbi:hypothetical protein DNTS_029089 [Danionella cerebrum]|uniref:PTB domain-containing engulfment adapter protein 1 n=1 Tax=Danionella cerebrum TaxID=2873325 RepID=A0A553QQJ9_9TELE|nr:hypothetical protein DNTS_029089 [Danionella translucida]